ncbi:MAG: DNA-processing protein DprA [Kiritimatiellae bacterium]|nr:DNA-processing protein DprA [Kiritimatiellia bacterium]
MGPLNERILYHISLDEIKGKMKENEAYIAFNLTDNIGSVGVGRLVERFGSVAAAWENYRKKVSRSGGEVEWQKEIAKAKSIGVEILTPADEDYPVKLRSAPGHPLALYVKGNVKALSQKAIAIVGTRRATPYGLDQAFRFGRDLAANGWAIISGLALGIDAEAHRGALEAENCVAIGVIGSGLNRFYPEKNIELARQIVKRGGAVVSEFPFGRDPDQKSFPQRNHVVAALADGVLAIEAPTKSGTLLTTTFAAELGKCVMALPGRVDSSASSGCLALIRDGATMVRCPQDVEAEYEDLFPKRMEEKNKVLDAEEAKPFIIKKRWQDARRDPYNPPNAPLGTPPDEAKIFMLLDSAGKSMDELVRASGFPAARVNTVCMTLLMKGKVRFLPGNRVALPRE